MIQTKIARIHSDTEVILAAGSEQGVKEGMVFVIYELGDEIHDPETSESLGQLELVKGRVKVAHVQEKVSHALTFLGKDSSPAFEGYSIWRQRQRLNVEGAVAVETDPTVRVGDLAHSVD